MDGNGRWAQQRGLTRSEGHTAGEDSLLDTTYGALSCGVKALTVFAFSSENWRRPVEEVRFLMNFNRSLLDRRQHQLNEDGVRIVFSRLARAPWGAESHGRGDRTHQKQQGSDVKHCL
jgi:undecaprenyl diphosphate synthase